MSERNKAEFAKNVLGLVALRRKWARRMGIRRGSGWSKNQFTPAMMNQLENCKDDEARRIILGISK